MSKLKEVLETLELPEVVLEKAQVLFETSVKEATNKSLTEELEKIQSTAEKKLEEEKQEWISKKSEELEKFTEATVLEWAKDNALGLDASIKQGLAESALSKIKELLISEGVDLEEMKKVKEEDEDKSDEDDLDDEEDEKTKKELEETKIKLEALQRQVTDYQKKEVLESVTKGLSVYGADRVKTLCESLEFKDVEKFKKSAELIAEAFLPKQTQGKGDEQVNPIVENGESTVNETTTEQVTTTAAVTESSDIVEQTLAYLRKNKKK